MIRLADMIPVEVDHSRIPAADRVAAVAQLLADAAGQQFPWLDGHPRIGAVVYWDGGLWTVLDRESGPTAESPSAITLIGPAWRAWPIEEQRGVARAELRPVTWTQAQEDEAQRGARPTLSVYLSNEPPSRDHHYHCFECQNGECDDSVVAYVRSRSPIRPVMLCPFCMDPMQYLGSEPADRDGYSQRR